MKNISKRLLISTAWFFLLQIMPSFGESTQHEAILEDYLNSIKTLKADLIQISSNGEVETGTLLLKKPGQMRFEYDAPSSHLVMASKPLLVVIDKNSNSEPQRYLTSQTPIGYLLAEEIKFHKNAFPKALFFKNNHIHLVLHNPNKPGAGELELVFLQKPIKLKEWTITSYSGDRTRVLLEKLSLNEPLDKRYFNIGREISKIKKSQSKN